MNPIKIIKSPEFYPNFIYQALVWTFAGIFFLFLRQGTSEYSIYGELSIKNLFAFVAPMGLIAGLIFGTTTTYIERYILYNKSFRIVIIASTFVYLFGFFLFTVLNFYRLSNMTGDLPMLANFGRYITDINSIIFIVYMVIVSIVFTLIRQVDKKMGKGILWRMIRGGYYEPKEVQRTFMFMDLRSSTTIAEKLGNIQYSKFLRDCFYELSTISCYRAEIYQFVGDEVVLTWPIKSKKTKMDVINTFLSFNAALKAKSDYFMKTYGVIPEFKAGIHSGTVTLAEVGQVKREMAYHGDTINTAARIQEECNNFNVNILISADAKKVLTLNDFSALRSLGPLKLRGRKEEIEVFTM